MIFLICVLQSTVRIDRELYLCLLAGAQAMWAAGRATRYDLDGEDFTGRVTTSWTYQVLGTFSGPMFTATLDVGSRTGQARFIVSERHLARDIDPDHIVIV